MANYKIPNLPSSRAYKEETADFWEVQTISNPNIFVSQTQISKIISMELDEIDHDGINSEDDIINEGTESRNGLDDVFAELQRRIQFTNNRYPFSFGTYSMKLTEEPSLSKSVYLFLLLCTRLNMKTQKIQDGLDGTQVFEYLCAYVAKQFFGDSSESYVFGTAQTGNFESKVKNLIDNIGEGKKFINPNNNAPTKRDDSIDVVVWKEFADKREGKLVGFGQCKTGTTSWREGIHRLKPKDFCGNWFNEQPVFNPLPLVFICDTMNEDFNFISSQRGYLVFNRYRILEYVDNSLPANIQNDISRWVTGALTTLDVRI